MCPALEPVTSLSSLGAVWGHHQRPQRAAEESPAEELDPPRAAGHVCGRCSLSLVGALGRSGKAEVPVTRGHEAEAALDPERELLSLVLASPCDVKSGVALVPLL